MRNKIKTMRNTNNNENIMSLIPVRSYSNADLQKSDICKDNNKKTGIYR